MGAGATKVRLMVAIDMRTERRVGGDENQATFRSDS